MKNKLNNPLRYNTISEMKDQEIGYISEDSLCFDIQEESGKAIYALFHYHPYSGTQNEEDYDEGDVYDIQIKCHIIENQRFFEVSNPMYKIKHEDLANTPARLYTILDQDREYISKLNAKKESLNTDELSNAFHEFIECILGNMEKGEDKDESYGRAWTNFSFSITELCHADNREDIEHILFNTYYLINNSENIDYILEQLSDYTNASDYMIQQLEEEKFEGFIDGEIQNKIGNISSCFHELYTEEETILEQTEGQSIQKDKKQLEKELEEAVKNDNYEKASELRDQIARLGGKEQTE